MNLLQLIFTTKHYKQMNPVCYPSLQNVIAKMEASHVCFSVLRFCISHQTIGAKAKSVYRALKNEIGRNNFLNLKT